MTRTTQLQRGRQLASPSVPLAMLLLLLLLLSSKHNTAGATLQPSLSSRSDRPDMESNAVATESSIHHRTLLLLNTTLCRDHCAVDDCVSYLTPLQTCYNGQTLFPGDPSWSNLYVYDAIMEDTHAVEVAGMHKEKDRAHHRYPYSYFHRSFFSTVDATCLASPTDVFQLPLTGECVGPFGTPRPWGSFVLVRKRNEEPSSSTVSLEKM